MRRPNSSAAWRVAAAVGPMSSRRASSSGSSPASPRSPCAEMARVARPSASQSAPERPMRTDSSSSSVRASAPSRIRRARGDSAGATNEMSETDSGGGRCGIELLRKGRRRAALARRGAARDAHEAREPGRPEDAPKGTGRDRAVAGAAGCGGRGTARPGGRADRRRGRARAFQSVTTKEARSSGYIPLARSGYVAIFPPPEKGTPSSSASFRSSAENSGWAGVTM